MITTTLSLTVNGDLYRVETLPMKRLLDVIRDDLHLTGTKEGCGEGECGACSVMLDGILVNSCLVPALHADGARVVTVEGLAEHPRGRIVGQSFAECGGAQCGICTPGMMMAAVYLLGHNPHPTREETRAALAGNLCRCTGYAKIIDAVQLASSRSE